MDFDDMPPKSKEKIQSIIDMHLEACSKILEKDNLIIPFIATYNSAPDTNTLACIQSKDGQVDFDKALAAGLKMLKEIKFDMAVFSHTALCSAEGQKDIDVIVSFVIDPNGLAVKILTSYKRRGLFKKSVEYIETGAVEVIENIFKS